VLDVLSYIISVIGIVALIVSAVVTFIAYGFYSAFKLMFGVEWLRWLTLDEIVAMGHSRFWCEILLPIFYRKGNILTGGTLLIRLKHNLPDPLRELVAEIGFERDTVQYHEFKFTSHGGKRRGNLQKFRVEILQPMPMYRRRRVRL